MGTDGALLFPSSDTAISNLIFINCDNGVEYDSDSDSTSPSFNNFTFDDVGGNYDVNNTSGGAITISKNSGADPNSYNPAGDAVTFAGASVLTEITVKDTSTPPVAIEDAQTIVWVTDGSNYFYQTTVTITSSGTTASVSHAGHGMSNGDKVYIYGANEVPYNGAKTVSNVSTDAYDYTMLSDPDDTATGTIKATFLIISGDTNSSGVISDTRQWGSAQAIAGRSRKSASSPFYEEGTFIGEISTTGGFSVTLQLGSDE